MKNSARKDLIEFYKVGIEIKEIMYKSALNRLCLNEASLYSEQKREYLKKVIELENTL